jgi:hypothetical protein
MQENSNQTIIRTKGVVLPFGFSKVPVVIDQEEESKLIDAIKENKEIIFVYNGENGLAEYGCSARVSSYNDSNSYTNLVRSQFNKALKDLNNSGYSGFPIFNKTDLISDLGCAIIDPKQFKTLDEIELLLIDVVQIKSIPDGKSVVIQNDKVEKIDKNDLEKFYSILGDNSNVNQIDCFHTVSFYTLTKILPQNTLRNNLLKLQFLKTNSETQRMKSIIKLYESNQLFSK